MAAKMDSMPSVYGNIQYAIAHDNFDGGPSNIEHFDNGSTLGVVHDHEIAPGVTGFFKIEIDRLGADDIGSFKSGLVQMIPHTSVPLPKFPSTLK